MSAKKHGLCTNPAPERCGWTRRGTRRVSREVSHLSVADDEGRDEFSRRRQTPTPTPIAMAIITTRAIAIHGHLSTGFLTSRPEQCSSADFTSKTSGAKGLKNTCGVVSGTV